jgi:hypothetical protein
MIRYFLNGEEWQFYCEEEGWRVERAWPMAGATFRMILSTVVESDWQLAGMRLRWRPDIDPFAISFQLGDDEALLLWLGDCAVLVLLVPEELPQDIAFQIGNTVSVFLTLATRLLNKRAIYELESLQTESAEEDEDIDWHRSVFIYRA